MNIVFYFFFILFLASVSFAGEIYGTIVNQEDSPISDVQVQLLNTVYTDITDSEGHFRFQNLSTGKYQLIFYHISYQKKLLEPIQVKTGIVFDIGTIRLKTGIFEIQNVVITATRTEHQAIDLAQSVNSISSLKIAERAVKTSAEILREEPGIAVQKTGHGGGSPTIRGLSSNRILLLVDGIRLNNSTYRLGNHQYLTTVDYHILDRVEVVHGPGSVQYGSDAIGGTINLITRTPQPAKNQNRFLYNLSGKYASADQERTIRPELSYQASSFAVQAGYALKFFNDLHRGSYTTDEAFERTKTSIQKPSGFSASDKDLKFIIKPAEHLEIKGGYQFSSKNDVPRYDKYENEDYHKWLYTIQNRELYFLTYRQQFVSDFVNSLDITTSYHLQDENREIQKSSNSSLILEKDGISTLGLNAQLISYQPNNLITFGFDTYHDNVKSGRQIKNASTGTIQKNIRGRYPDDASYNQFGVYLQDEIDMTRYLNLTPGLRYSHHATYFSLKADSLLQNQVNLNFSSLTASVGVQIRLISYLRLNFLFSRGYRAPNLSDLSKLGESKSFTYEIPNPHLKAEQAQNLDMALHLKTGISESRLTFYYTRLSRLISSADATLDGQSSLIIEDVESKIKSKQNIGKGYITGLEFLINTNISTNFNLRGNLTYSYGQNETQNEPVDGIPPLFGLVGIQYNFATIRFDSFIRFSTRQSRLSADDLDDLRIPPGGSPHWYTINFRTFFKVNPWLSVNLACENVMDYNYREHGSGINAPGRDLILSFKMSR